MPSLTINLANVQGNIRSFPDGVYAARVTDAKLDVSSTGNPMIAMELEIHHPTLGSATIRDWLSAGFASKGQAFYQAVSGMTVQQLADQLARNPDIDIDPDDIIGAELLVNIADKPARNDPSKVYKNVVEPFYFPFSRVDLLAWQDNQ